MTIKTSLAHKKFWLALAVGWTLVIAVLCLVSFKKLPSVKLHDADKYVHAIFHCVFTLLWFMYIRNVASKPLFRVFLGSLLYGGLIEILQGVLTTTRKADLEDVAANTFGALVAVTILLILDRKQKQKQN